MALKYMTWNEELFASEISILIRLLDDTGRLWKTLKHSM